MATQYRQGDVLIEAIEELPKNKKEIADKTLAIGESMNHGHMLVGEAMVYETEKNEKYFEVFGDCSLKHLKIDNRAWTQEHHEILLPKGKYKVIHQREYDPYEEVVRSIRD